MLNIISIKKYGNAMDEDLNPSPLLLGNLW
jgi:hypothetical protein